MVYYNKKYVTASIFAILFSGLFSAQTLFAQLVLPDTDGPTGNDTQSDQPLLTSEEVSFDSPAIPEIQYPDSKKDIDVSGNSSLFPEEPILPEDPDREMPETENSSSFVDIMKSPSEIPTSSDSETPAITITRVENIPGSEPPVSPVPQPVPQLIYPVSSQIVSLGMSRNYTNLIAKIYYPRGIKTKCPVVIYSHGLGGSLEQCAYLGHKWASCGIISIHLNHPGSNESVWRGKVRPMNELKEAYQKYWTGRDRALAIRHTIDRIQAMQHSNSSLFRMMDTTKIGVAGNDLGALAALMVAGQLPPDNGPLLKDERVTAVLALGPPVHCSSAQGSVVYSGILVPFMSFAGTEDNGVIGTTKAYQRRIPYDNIQGIDKFHITLRGADHMVYGGHRMKSKKQNDVVYQKTIQNISTLFWRAYLLNDASALSTLRSAIPSSFTRVGAMERYVY